MAETSAPLLQGKSRISLRKFLEHLKDVKLPESERRLIVAVVHPAGLDDEEITVENQSRLLSKEHVRTLAPKLVGKKVVSDHGEFDNSVSKYTREPTVVGQVIRSEIDEAGRIIAVLEINNTVDGIWEANKVASELKPDVSLGLFNTTNFDTRTVAWDLDHVSLTAKGYLPDTKILGVFVNGKPDQTRIFQHENTDLYSKQAARLLASSALETDNMSRMPDILEMYNKAQAPVVEEPVAEPEPEPAPMEVEQPPAVDIQAQLKDLAQKMTTALGDYERMYGKTKQEGTAESMAVADVTTGTTSTVPDTVTVSEPAPVIDSTPQPIAVFNSQSNMSAFPPATTTTTTSAPEAAPQSAQPIPTHDATSQAKVPDLMAYTHEEIRATTDPNSLDPIRLVGNLLKDEEEITKRDAEIASLRKQLETVASRDAQTLESTLQYILDRAKESGTPIEDITIDDVKSCAQVAKTNPEVGRAMGAIAQVAYSFMNHANPEAVRARTQREEYATRALQQYSSRFAQRAHPYQPPAQQQVANSAYSQQSFNGSNGTFRTPGGQPTKDDPIFGKATSNDSFKALDYLNEVMGKNNGVAKLSTSSFAV